MPASKRILSSDMHSLIICEILLFGAMQLSAVLCNESISMRPKVLDDQFFILLLNSKTQRSVTFSNATNIGKPGQSHPSSVIALLAILALACLVIVASLVTFNCHRAELQERKLRKAHEEYERDQEKCQKNLLNT